MSLRTYSEEEKKAYVDEFKESGLSITAYARERKIPTTTLRDWLRLDKALEFGKIDLEKDLKSEQATMKQIPHKKSIVFAMENIRIELKEGYNKKILKQIIEVLDNVE